MRAASTVLFGALQRIGTPQKTLAELTETPQYGFTASSSIEPIGPKFVRITDIQDGAINWDSVPYCECLESDKYLLKPNDILFARTGATTGKTYLVKEAPFAIFASYLIRIRPKSDISPAYLYSFFQSNLYWSQIAVEKEGSAQPNVNGKKLSSVEMPIVDSTLQTAIATFLQVVRDRQDGSKEPLPELLPPLSEQRRIVARVEELAAKIEEARRLRKKAGEEVIAILPSALDSIFERNGAEKWPRKKLIDEKLAFVVAGQHIMVGEYNSSGEGIPYLTGPADFGPKVPEIRHWTPTPKSTSLPGDILLTVKGAGVGKINLAPDVESAIGRQLMAIRSNPEKLLREFVYYFLNHRFKHFQSIATATTVPGFKKNDVEELVVPVPLLPEQRCIVAYLDDLQAKVEALRRLQAETGAELDALLPAVLDRAFKGEME